MKIKKAIKVALYMYCFCFLLFQSKAYTQSVLEPSATHTISSEFIDFEHGFRAKKGTFFTANIDVNIIPSGPIPVDHALNADFSDESTVEVTKSISNESNLSYSEFLSETEQFNSTKMEFGLTVYPNPFLDQIDIVVNTEDEGPLRIDIYNVQGQLVKKVIDVNSSFKGNQVFNVNVDDLQQGLYFVNLNTNTQSSSIKIIK